MEIQDNDYLLLIFFFVYGLLLIIENYENSFKQFNVGKYNGVTNNK